MTKNCVAPRLYNRHSFHSTRPVVIGHAWHVRQKKRVRQILVIAGLRSMLPPVAPQQVAFATIAANEWKTTRWFSHDTHAPCASLQMCTHMCDAPQIHATYGDGGGGRDSGVVGDIGLGVLCRVYIYRLCITIARVRCIAVWRLIHGTHTHKHITQNMRTRCQAPHMSLRMAIIRWHMHTHTQTHAPVSTMQSPAPGNFFAAYRNACMCIGTYHVATCMPHACSRMSSDRCGGKLPNLSRCPDFRCSRTAIRTFSEFYVGFATVAAGVTADRLRSSNVEVVFVCVCVLCVSFSIVCMFKVCQRLTVINVMLWLVHADSAMNISLFIRQVWHGRTGVGVRFPWKPKVHPQRWYFSSGRYWAGKEYFLVMTRHSFISHHRISHDRTYRVTVSSYVNSIASFEFYRWNYDTAWHRSIHIPIWTYVG